MQIKTKNKKKNKVYTAEGDPDYGCAYIAAKNSKEANRESYLCGRNKIHSSILYKQQWHTTWNNKKVYLHSSYELDYAKQLDDKQIDYDVESLHIKYWDSQQQRYRCAIPDFYIPSKHLIVEIKSNQK